MESLYQLWHMGWKFVDRSVTDYRLVFMFNCRGFLWLCRKQWVTRWRETLDTLSELCSFKPTGCIYYTLDIFPLIFLHHASIKYSLILNAAYWELHVARVQFWTTKVCMYVWQRYLWTTRLWSTTALEKYPMYAKQLHSYNTEMTVHSHTCVFTCLWLVKILMHALEISPHIAHWFM